LNIGVEMPTIESIKTLCWRQATGSRWFRHHRLEPGTQAGELVSIPVKELKLERKLRLVYRPWRTALPRGHALSCRWLNSISSDAKGRYLYQPER